MISEAKLPSDELDLSGDKSTLVQVMAWRHQATSHYLNQCWPRSLPPYGITRPQWVNTRLYTIILNWNPCSLFFSALENSQVNTPHIRVGIFQDHDDVIKWKHFLHYWPGNSPVTSGLPSQRPVTQRFGVIFDMYLNKEAKRLWFEVPSCSLWCHCNVNPMCWCWWCPGSSHRHAISSHDIDPVRYQGADLI